MVNYSKSDISAAKSVKKLIFDTGTVTEKNIYESGRVMMWEQMKPDWNTLRNKFFAECVENGKVSIAPHDLFEWIKNNVR